MKCKYGHEMPENEFLCSACFSEGRKVSVVGECPKNRIEVIKNWLRSFAENNRAEMSVNVYNGIWDLIQSIEQEEKEEIKERRSK